jgi:hypothetical protein
VLGYQIFSDHRYRTHYNRQRLASNLPRSSDLDAEVASVDVVSQEQVACLGRIAAHFKQLHEVVVLSVDVTAHGYGRVHLQQVGLRLENLGTLLYDP